MSRVSRDRAGFTLVEALVAIVILSVVLGSIYGAFRAGSLSTSRAEERADAYQTARVLLAQINAELCSALPLPGAETSAMVGEDTPGSETAPQFDKIRFLTVARRSFSLSGQAGDLCEVCYRLESTADGQPVGLFVEENRHPGLDVSSARPARTELSARVVALNCKYLDPSNDEWIDEWVDRSGLPKAVRVEVAVKPEREGAKPIVVATTANIVVSPSPAEQPTGGESVAE